MEKTAHKTSRQPLDNIFNLIEDAYDHGLIGINQDTGEIYIMINIFDQQTQLTFKIPKIPHYIHCSCNTVFAVDELKSYGAECPYCHKESTFTSLDKQPPQKAVPIPIRATIRKYQPQATMTTKQPTG